MKEWDIFERGYLDFEAFLSVIATYMKVEQLDQKVEEDYLTICGLTEKEAHQVEVRIARRSSLSLSDPGKYSKRRRSNVAVIIVRIVFISSFLFYCLLSNHIFQTNPNRITNCSKLFALLQLTTTLLLRRFLILQKC